MNSKKYYSSSFKYFSLVVSGYVFFVSSVEGIEGNAPGWYQCETREGQEYVVCGDDSSYKRITDLATINKLKKEVDLRYSSDEKKQEEDRLALVVDLTIRSSSEATSRINYLSEQISNKSTPTSEKLRNAGMIKELLGQTEDAKIIYENLSRYKSGDKDAALRLLLIDMKNGKSAESIGLIKEIMSSDSKLKFTTISGKSASIQTVLADALLASGRDSEALEAYEVAMKVNPQDNHSVGRFVQLVLANSSSDPSLISRAISLSDKIPDDYRFRDLRAFVSSIKDNPEDIKLNNFKIGIVQRHCI